MMFQYLKTRNLYSICDAGGGQGDRKPKALLQRENLMQNDEVAGKESFLGTIHKERPAKTRISRPPPPCVWIKQ